MSKFESEPTEVPRRPPTLHAVVVSSLAVSFGVLLAAPAVPVIHYTLTLPSGTLQAMAIVGVVLAEAIALSVGYGALAATIEPYVRERLGGDSAWNSSD